MKDASWGPVGAGPSNEKIDVLLVTVPTSVDQEFGLLSGGGAHRPPLNLLNIGATLLQSGYHVKIIDGASSEITIDEFFARAVAANPRHIGLTAMTAHIHKAGEIANRLREALPQTTIIIGGIHVSTLPEETMNLFPAFDIGVIGEGDITIVDLVKCLDAGGDLSQIAGIIYREGTELRTTPARPLIKNLDDLPLPAWHLLPGFVTTYMPTMTRRTRLPSAYIVTSRGCPFSCTFCNNIVHGRTFRSYSVPRLMEIVNHMVNVYKVRDLTIYDENLALDRKRITDFCNRLIEFNYDLTWSCDARADCIDDEIVSLMARAGCRSIWFGMESGNSDILKRYKKKLNLDDISKAVSFTKKHGVKACGSFIIGGPQETPATIKDTIRFAKSLKLDYFVPFFYTPVPGTTDYADISRYGTVDLDYRSANMTRPTFAPHGMTLNQVYYWYNRALISFYCTPRTILSFLSGNNPLQIMKMGFSFIFNMFKLLLRLAVKAVFTRKNSDHI